LQYAECKGNVVQANYKKHWSTLLWVFYKI